MSIVHVKSNTIPDWTGYVKSLLSYDPATGEMRWLVKRTRNSKANVGDLAGGVDESGYIRIMIDGKKHRAHRLAFIFMGETPPEIVDHINGDRSDNRWVNLRRADPSINAKNASKRVDGKTIITGVGYVPRLGKWRVRINHNGKSIYLGVFESAAQAIAVRESANANLGFHENHGRPGCQSSM